MTDERDRIIREAAIYTAGMAEALAWAAELSLEAPASKAGRAKPASQRSHRKLTARPILDILRTAGQPLRVSEILAEGHRLGHDLLRGSVERALPSLIARGVVARKGQAYHIAAADPP